MTLSVIDRSGVEWVQEPAGCWHMPETTVEQGACDTACWSTLEQLRATRGPLEDDPAVRFSDHVAAIDAVLALVRDELVSATEKFGPFASAHEGFAIIREEVDELWDEIKADKVPGARGRMRREALQVAAMGARFLLDVPAVTE